MACVLGVEHGRRACIEAFLEDKFSVGAPDGEKHTGGLLNYPYYNYPAEPEAF